jgi:hypothetical protein
MGAAGGLPAGTVAFLFTDLEGSTRLLQAHPVAYRGPRARHGENRGARHPDECVRPSAVTQDKRGYLERLPVALVGRLPAVACVRGR